MFYFPYLLSPLAHALSSYNNQGCSRLQLGSSDTVQVYHVKGSHQHLLPALERKPTGRYGMQAHQAPVWQAVPLCLSHPKARCGSLAFLFFYACFPLISDISGF